MAITNLTNDSAVNNVVLKGSEFCDTRKSVKKEVKAAIGDALSKGEINPEQARAAKRLVSETASALAAKNRYETTASLNEDGEKPVGFDAKADKIMQDAGLNVDDLLEAGKLAGSDYTVGRARQGKMFNSKDSEFKQIKDQLNEKIAQNGGKPLSNRDVVKLMRAIGLNVGGMNPVVAMLGNLIPGVNVNPAQFFEAETNHTEQIMDRLS